MIHPGATLYMYLSRDGELVKVQTLDLSTQVGNIKGIWNDGPRLYIRGIMRDNWAMPNYSACRVSADSET